MQRLHTKAIFGSEKLTELQERSYNFVEWSEKCKLLPWKIHFARFKMKALYSIVFRTFPF